MQAKTTLQGAICIVLCFLLSPVSGFCYQAAGAQPAGNITALDPAATRNGTMATAREQVQWNDELATDQAGRMRVGLGDGSILSLGANSRLRVVQHNAAAQQTTLEMLYGRLRSQVMKLTHPNSNFEVRTPTAVAGVIGTDFLVIATADRTTVIVFSGIVHVTPRNPQTGTQSDSQSVSVNPMQQVEVTAAGPGSIQPVTQQLMQQLIQQTAVSRAGLAANAGVQAASHTLRAVLIGIGSVAAGAVAGVAIANATHNSNPAPKPPSGPGIPPQ